MKRSAAPAFRCGSCRSANCSCFPLTISCWVDRAGKATSAHVDISVRHGLHFDQRRQTGVVFHMMRALSEFGRIGLTAVEESHEKAKVLYDRVVAALDEEASLAAEQRPLPDVVA